MYDVQAAVDMPFSQSQAQLIIWFLSSCRWSYAIHLNVAFLLSTYSDCWSAVKTVRHRIDRKTMLHAIILLVVELVGPCSVNIIHKRSVANQIMVPTMIFQTGWVLWPTFMDMFLNSCWLMEKPKNMSSRWYWKTSSLNWKKRQLYANIKTYQPLSRRYSYK